ncbi:MAG: response regulator [Dermatophilaceae bacterium]
MTSVVIVDDQDLIRSGLWSLLALRGVDVVGDAADGRRGVEIVTEAQPDVVLMDIRLPRLDGIAATKEIVRRRLVTRVLVVTTYDLDEYVYGALRAGAAGFLLKSIAPERLVEGIETVARGEALLAPALTRRIIEEYVHRPPPVSGVPHALAALTSREVDVLRLIASGLSNSEIGDQLVVSEATVKTHVNRLFAKLGLQSRAQAVVLAYECGLVVPGNARSVMPNARDTTRLA